MQRVLFALYFNSYRSHEVGVGGCYYCSYHVGALSAWEKNPASVSVTLKKREICAGILLLISQRVL